MDFKEMGGANASPLFIKNRPPHYCGSQTLNQTIMEMTQEEFLLTLQVTPLTKGEDLELAKENYEWWPNDNVDYYKILCTAVTQDNEVYFRQDRNTKKFFMFFDRSEFESEDLIDMLIASKHWFHL